MPRQFPAVLTAVAQIAAQSQYFRKVPLSVPTRSALVEDVLTPTHCHDLSELLLGHLGHLYPFFQDLFERKEIEKSLRKEGRSALCALIGW